MIDHDVRVGPSEADLQRDGRVARTMAGVAAGAVAVARPVAGAIARADRPAVKAAGRGKVAPVPVSEAADGRANGSRTMAPSGSETLAVALQDGDWRHIDGCAPKRATRPEAERLPHEIETRTGQDRTRRYCVADPNELPPGSGMETVPRHGDTLKDEMAVANPQPPGVRPFGWRHPHVQDDDRGHQRHPGFEWLPGSGTGPAAPAGRRALPAEHRLARRRARIRQARHSLRLEECIL